MSKFIIHDHFEGGRFFGIDEQRLTISRRSGAAYPPKQRNKGDIFVNNDRSHRPGQPSYFVPNCHKLRRDFLSQIEDFWQLY